MAVIALLDRRARGTRTAHLAFDRLVLRVIDSGAIARHDHPVAFFEIADLLRQRGQRQRVRPDIGLAIAIADDQRRAAAGADQQIGMVAEGDRQRKGTAQARQHSGDGFLRTAARFDQPRHEMRDHFAIGIAFERAAIGAQFGAQFLIVLDDSIVHQRHLPGRMRMRILRGRRAVRGPARMRDAGVTGGGVVRQFDHQIVELALGAPADQFALVERADPGAVIAAVFHPAQAIDQPFCNGFCPDDPDNSAHAPYSPIGCVARDLAVPDGQSIGPAEWARAVRLHDGQSSRAKDVLTRHPLLGNNQGFQIIHHASRGGLGRISAKFRWANQEFLRGLPE